VNRILPELEGGRPALYLDTDPGYTQLKLAPGDAPLRAILEGGEVLPEGTVRQRFERVKAKLRKLAEERGLVPK
jgi:hypothetical protein